MCVINILAVLVYISFISFFNIILKMTLTNVIKDKDIFLSLSFITFLIYG